MIKISNIIAEQSNPFVLEQGSDIFIVTNPKENLTLRKDMDSGKLCTIKNCCPNKEKIMVKNVYRGQRVLNYLESVTYVCVGKYWVENKLHLK